MYNNYTDIAQYQCYSVILKQTQGKGALIIGDLNSPTQPSLIHNYNIKTIITAAAGMDHITVSPSINHIVYPLLDSKAQNIKTYFEVCSNIIEDSMRKGGVLVHCSAGISRSATLVIAFIMRKKKVSFKEAIKIVRRRRKNVCPNLGFERQLKDYEKEIVQKKKLQLSIISNPLPGKKCSSLHSSNNLLKNDRFSNDFNMCSSKTAEEQAKRNLLVQLSYHKKCTMSGQKERSLVLGIKKGKQNFRKLQSIIQDKQQKINHRKHKNPISHSNHPSNLKINWPHFKTHQR